MILLAEQDKSCQKCQTFKVPSHLSSQSAIVSKLKKFGRSNLTRLPEFF